MKSVWKIYLLGGLVWVCSLSAHAESCLEFLGGNEEVDSFLLQSPFEEVWENGEAVFKMNSECDDVWRGIAEVYSQDLLFEDTENGIRLARDAIPFVEDLGWPLLYPWQVAQMMPKNYPGPGWLTWLPRETMEFLRILPELPQNELEQRYFLNYVLLTRPHSSYDLAPFQIQVQENQDRTSDSPSPLAFFFGGKNPLLDEEDLEVVRQMPMDLKLLRDWQHEGDYVRRWTSWNLLAKEVFDFDQEFDFLRHFFHAKDEPHPEAENFWKLYNHPVVSIFRNARDRQESLARQGFNRGDLNGMLEIATFGFLKKVKMAYRMVYGALILLKPTTNWTELPWVPKKKPKSTLVLNHFKTSSKPMISLSTAQNTYRFPLEALPGLRDALTQAKESVD